MVQIIRQQISVWYHLIGDVLWYYLYKKEKIDLKKHIKKKIIWFKHIFYFFSSICPLFSSFLNLFINPSRLNHLNGA